ncbi:uncharacterized protein LOC142496672 isoform X5 [Ascaphus truei]|uniref:uncharacterized protein LOC142496672 isoform X5 n=1 Tax=Ascaphus truei TaxID=8439 RepID=UPI003F5A1209
MFITVLYGDMQAEDMEHAKEDQTSNEEGSDPGSSNPIPTPSGVTNRPLNPRSPLFPPKSDNETRSMRGPGPQAAGNLSNQEGEEFSGLINRPVQELRKSQRITWPPIRMTYDSIGKPNYEFQQSSGDRFAFIMSELTEVYNAI